MNWKSTAVVSGATLLATWLGWTSTPQHATVTEAPATTVRDARPLPGVDIQEQAQKLEHRVRAQVEYQDPTRNPFVFGSRRLTARTSGAAPAAAHPVAPPPATSTEPAPLGLTLAGIASGEGNQRTAIIETGSGVAFVKEGDRVGTLSVARVTDSSVALVDSDGAVQTLTLKP